MLPACNIVTSVVVIAVVVITVAVVIIAVVVVVVEAMRRFRRLPYSEWCHNTTETQPVHNMKDIIKSDINSSKY